MLKPSFLLSLFIAVLVSSTFTSYAQPAWTFDPFGKEKKPEKYEEKILASEKTGQKKFKGLRKIIQNGTSHYNFYYNCNNKINAVIERAKISNKDNYAKFLSFYPYALVNTATQKTDLDSVIYKATSGILLHDLRTEWVDNFYLIIGKAYFLKKDFDSAALTFQFINYNLFPRKKKDDDYDKIVGSNETSTNGIGSVSIANKEKRNVLQKAFTLPPSRNDALIWQIRTFTEQKEYGDATGLISILQNDANLPTRLQNDLEEVTAYWFYAQNNFDSAATHLAKGLSNADNKQDKSRWEYLLAQMYELTGKYDDASKYYTKAAAHTTDPVMDIYARLNDAKMLRKTGDIAALKNSINNLLRMAGKDKYDGYRDIIYYSAAQLSMQAPDTSNAINYYFKSIAYNPEGTSYKDKSFIELGDIAYTQRQYKNAKSYYDSIAATGNELEIDLTDLNSRKEILGRLIPKINAIELQDSVQAIALMDAKERDILIKKIVKKYRKENGLKDEEDFAGNTLITFANKNNEPVDLFKAAAANTGDWYFYSANLRSKGFNDFKTKWGKRNNTDNWRRKSAQTLLSTNAAGAPRGLSSSPDDLAASGGIIDADGKPINTNITYESLMASLPLTPEQVDSSNQVIAQNLYAAAIIFQNELQDYNKAIELYEDYIRRFTNLDNMPNVYRNLSFCYSKIGNSAQADLLKNKVLTNYAGSDAAKIIANPNLLNTTKKSPEATTKYEEVYNLFIEGNFEEAIALKKQADSTYGTNFWSPQLLYIESMYYIKNREDSTAIAILKNFQNLYPTSPLKPKVATMIDVLGRRAGIEKYLTDLQVTRVADDQVIVADTKAPIVVAAPVLVPTEVKTTAPVITQKVITNVIQIPEVYINKSFVLKPDMPHYVAMILDKVDGVYVTEARNAFIRFNKTSMATINTTIVKDTLDTNKALLLFSTFSNAAEAIKYFDVIKKAAPTEVSWLQPAKYSFIIISDDNLQLLKTNKDLPTYKQLINTNFGNKF